MLFFYLETAWSNFKLNTMFEWKTTKSLHGHTHKIQKNFKQVGSHYWLKHYNLDLLFTGWSYYVLRHDCFPLKKIEDFNHYKSNMVNDFWPNLYYSTPFYKLLVPTVDTVRYQYLTSNLLKALCPVMLVGPVGTGKTSVAEDVLNKLDASKYSVLVLNMSAQVRWPMNSRSNQE